VISPTARPSASRPTRPARAGSFPAEDEQTIIGGTGAYEGATGRARLSGANFAVGFPLELTGDDIFIIELDR
jgi:hypothetical protein